MKPVDFIGIPEKRISLFDDRIEISRIALHSFLFEPAENLFLNLLPFAKKRFLAPRQVASLKFIGDVLEDAEQVRYLHENVFRLRRFLERNAGVAVQENFVEGMGA